MHTGHRKQVNVLLTQVSIEHGVFRSDGETGYGIWALWLSKERPNGVAARRRKLVSGVFSGNALHHCLTLAHLGTAAASCVGFSC